jgi:hypothetical protein
MEAPMAEGAKSVADPVVGEKSFGVPLKFQYATVAA